MNYKNIYITKKQTKKEKINNNNIYLLYLYERFLIII